MSDQNKENQDQLQELFNYLFIEHGLTLLESEMQEIIYIVNKIQDNKYKDILNRSRQVICSLKLSMLVHPDCTEDSEFDGFTTSAQEIEDEIENLLKGFNKD